MADKYWSKVGQDIERFMAMRRAYYAKFVAKDREMYDHMLKLARRRKRRAKAAAKSKGRGKRRAS